MKNANELREIYSNLKIDTDKLDNIVEGQINTLEECVLEGFTWTYMYEIFGGLNEKEETYVNNKIKSLGYKIDYNEKDKKIIRLPLNKVAVLKPKGF